MAATATRRATFALVARPGTARLARQSGLHPDLVRRLVSLGAVDPADPEAAAKLARVVRLRRDLGLNYAGAILVSELLARIERLEGSARWTRTS
jgi:chaperone modulatory protein CbpM